jgi:hypothetical protein
MLTGTTCGNIDCESVPSATCAATPGCRVNSCGGAMCSAATFAGMHLTQLANDSTTLTTFPYFAAHH